MEWSGRWWQWLGAWMAAAGPLLTAAPGLCQELIDLNVDLALVLAVDVSGSVDAREFELQMRGLAEAFLNPDVHAAIAQSPNRGVAVAVVQWSGGANQVLAVDWMVVHDTASSGALAKRIAQTPRHMRGGDTSIGGAINFAARLLDDSGFAGRRVIDVSSDGGADQSTAKAIANRARNAAIDRGITVNGLAILTEDPDLDGFYRHNVIGGAGAFVMVAESYGDFAAAIVRKLLREIGERPMAGAEPEGGPDEFGTDRQMRSGDPVAEDVGPSHRPLTRLLSTTAGDAGAEILR